MPFAVIAGFATLVLFRRDLHTVSIPRDCSKQSSERCDRNVAEKWRNVYFSQIAFLGGVFVNEVVNLSLKHAIRESRPIRREVIYTEYGMPSAHTQFMWFFATYATIFVFVR